MLLCDLVALGPNQTILDSVLLCLEDRIVDASQIRWALDEVWHKQLVRDQGEPGKSECRIVVWIQVFKEVSQVEQNSPLHFCVEALTHCDCTQDVNQ